MNFAALVTQRTPLHLRLLAIRCYILMEEDMHAACALFRDLCEEDERPANVAEFMHYWWDAMQSRYSLLDQAHGSAPHLSVDKAEEAVQLMWDGYECEGCHTIPLNVHDALANIPELESIWHKSGLSERAFGDRLKQVEPRLRQRLLVFKARRTPAQEMERWECASKLRRYHLEELRRVFWIDATTIYVVPTGFKALVPPGASVVIEDDRMPKDYRHAVVLRFYCCVNAVAGPVAIKFHTGTTKLKQAKKYWVSTGIVFLAALASV